MSRWMKLVAVALGAVVGLVPAFVQVSYAQAVPESVPVLPVGRELVDDELCDIVGAYPGFTRDLLVGAALGITTGFAASQSGASLEISVTIGALTFLGLLAGGWSRTPPRVSPASLWAWRGE